MVMTHPGLPALWGTLIILGMVIASAWALLTKPRPQRGSPQAPAAGAERPGPSRFGAVVSSLLQEPSILAFIRILFVILFALIVLTGLMGTPVAGANLATVLTWNIWWTGLVVAIFFLGSAWCAVCPWNTLAGWLVHRRLWRRAGSETSLSLQVPVWLRNLMPAFALLLILTWLELGIEVTSSPQATALIAIAMLVLTALSMVTFERRAFCRFFCPVGRTVGFYAQLAPVELRPTDKRTCTDCITRECYHGSAEVDPCPTHQLMGTMTQNTYCLSCLNCVRSCPHDNVGWRLRAPSREAISDARPHWDEAIFMIGLLALTLFHGLIMMPFWEDWTQSLAAMFSQKPWYLLSFTLLFATTTLATYLVYAAAIWLTQHFATEGYSFKRLFALFSFSALPIAFAYHIAHNLNHLFREHGSLWSVLNDPFGQSARAPFDISSGSVCVVNGQLQVPMLTPEWLLHLMQSGLILGGFAIALLVIRSRGSGVDADQPRAHAVELGVAGRVPLLAYAALMSLFIVWLLSQPMTMRM